MKSILLLATLLATGTASQPDRWVPDEAWLRASHPRNHPKEGFVTKKETALAIGRATIEERYGAEFLKAEGPLDAKRFGGVWVVYGYKPVDALGGTVDVILSVRTGAISNVFVEQ